jgi:hypothetical protein
MNKIGRPSKYTPELLEKAKGYIAKYESLDHAFPSDIGLADYLDIGTTTLYDWEKDEDKKEFADILGEIDRKQQLVAWNRGLRGDYNANLVKLLLGKHGFSEKRENEQIGEINHDHKYTIEVVKAK